jgi:hypothetical protein
MTNDSLYMNSSVMQVILFNQTEIIFILETRICRGRAKLCDSLCTTIKIS